MDFSCEDLKLDNKIDCILYISSQSQNKSVTIDFGDQTSETIQLTSIESQSFEP